jgi:Protein of unknown function (DUF1203)
MDFRITGLPAAPFAPLFAMTDEELARHRALRRTCDEKPGFPCRVSLEDAEPGEEVLLVNFEHLPVDSPYRAAHAIYVRAKARETFDAVNEVPEALRSRLLAVRAFDARGLMVAADIVEGREVTPLVERFLANSGVDYLHAHFARRGCFAARIERA